MPSPQLPNPFHSRSPHFRLRGLALLKRWIGRLQMLGVALAAIVFLSGCVRYETGLSVQDANHGEWTQRIRLEEVPPGLGETIAASWLDSVKEKAKQFGGQVNSVSDEELWLRIPFYSMRDLETKFNQFFQPPGTLPPKGGYWSQREQKPLNLPVRMQVQTRHGLFREQERLTLDFDLRSLKKLIAQSGVAVNSDEFLDLDLRLTTPTPTTVLTANGASQPTTRRQGKQISWKLKPGQLNHLELAFTVPNYLSTGFIVISLMVLTGMLVKFLMLPVTAVLPSEMVAEEAGDRSALP